MAHGAIMGGACQAPIIPPSVLAIIVATIAQHVSPGVMMILLMAIPFVICMVLDEFAAMLILIPIYAPLLAPLGYDPIWFWTIFLINMSLGAIAPPVGYVLIGMQGVIRDVKISELYRASTPYVPLFIAAMFLMGILPQIILFAL